MKLYPTVIVEGKSFVGSKKYVVPMQALSLKEILRRFVRRESLPVSHEGTYDDRHEYDLEKLAHEDLIVKEEVLNEMKEKAQVLKARLDKEESEKKDAMKKAAAAKRKELFDELKREYQTPQTANADKA